MVDDEPGESMTPNCLRGGKLEGLPNLLNCCNMLVTRIRLESPGKVKSNVRPAQKMSKLCVAELEPERFRLSRGRNH